MNPADRRLILLQFEVVTYATFLALPVPALFFCWHRSNVVHAFDLFVTILILIPTTALFCIISRGLIFPNFIGERVIRVIIYVWGVVLLILSALIVYYTGGVASSIFAWLFEYALIVALLVRPKRSISFLARWRPVLFVVIIEIILIFLLFLIQGHQIPEKIKDSMPIWGSISILFSLVVSFFLFWVSEYRLGSVG